MKLKGKNNKMIRPKAWDFWHLDFIPKGCIVLLVGAGGSGKSTFMSWLAERVCNEQCRVAILSNEEEAGVIAARSDPFSRVTIASRFDKDINRKITTQDIVDTLEDYEVIFVDSLRTVTDLDLRYSQNVEKVFDPFLKAVSGTNKTIVFLHHPNKGGGDTLQDIVSGSERLVSGVRHCDLTIKDDIGDQRLITVAKTNCLKDDPVANHSFVIVPTTRTLEGGETVVVVSKLVPFQGDIEEIIYRNSQKAKQKKWDKKLLSELREQNKVVETPPAAIQRVLLKFSGESIVRNDIIAMGEGQNWDGAIRRTGTKWVTKTKVGTRVTYHFTDLAKEWLDGSD